MLYVLAGAAACAAYEDGEVVAGAAGVAPSPVALVSPTTPCLASMFAFSLSPSATLYLT
jgi:hypothetical protein